MMSIHSSRHWQNLPSMVMIMTEISVPDDLMMIFVASSFLLYYISIAYVGLEMKYMPLSLMMCASCGDSHCDLCSNRTESETTSVGRSRL